MRSPTVWSAASMNDVPLAVLMSRLRVVTGPILPGSKSSRGRMVNAAPLPASATPGRLGAHTANDRDAGSSAGDIAMMPSAMRRSNSAHTAAGSPSTS